MDKAPALNCCSNFTIFSTRQVVRPFPICLGLTETGTVKPSAAPFINRDQTSKKYLAIIFDGAEVKWVVQSGGYSGRKNCFVIEALPRAVKVGDKLGLEVTMGGRAAADGPIVRLAFNGAYLRTQLTLTSNFEPTPKKDMYFVHKTVSAMCYSVEGLILRSNSCCEHGCTSPNMIRCMMVCLFSFVLSHVWVLLVLSCRSAALLRSVPRSVRLL